MEKEIYYEKKQNEGRDGYRWACAGALEAKVFMWVPTLDDVLRIAKRRYPEHECVLVAL